MKSFGQVRKKDGRFVGRKLLMIDTLRSGRGKPSRRLTDAMKGVMQVVTQRHKDKAGWRWCGDPKLEQPNEEKNMTFN